MMTSGDIKKDVKMYNIKDYDDCKGCSASNSTGKCHTNTIDAKGNKCPCGKCLVKSMCKNGCPDYYKFWSNQ